MGERGQKAFIFVMKIDTANDLYEQLKIDGFTEKYKIDLNHS